MSSETYLFIMFVVSLIAIGFFLKIALDKIGQIYMAVVSNVASEPENIAAIKDNVEMSMLEHQEIAGMIEEMYKKIEDISAAIDNLNGSFLKQYPNSRNFTQTMRATNPVTVSNNKK